MCTGITLLDLEIRSLREEPKPLVPSAISPRCQYSQCSNYCKKTGHSARDCKVRPTANYNNNNNNNNNQRTQGTNPRVITCFECGLQGHYRSDCPKLKNGNQGNRAGNGNAVARAYAVGSAGTNPNSNVVTAQKYLLEGCPIFLAQVTMKEAEDKSKEKQLEEVPIFKTFPEYFRGLPVFHQLRHKVNFRSI
ncbi:putative reverse transcriptase domain-containing protein [Tanacetum coccineum]